MEERRDTKRIPFRTKVKLGKDKTELIARTFNISELGIGIESRRIYPPGTKIVINIEDGSKSNIVSGKVTWAHSNLPGLPSRMGVRINETDINVIKEVYRKKSGK